MLDGIWAVVNAASWTAFGEAEWVPMGAFTRMINVNLIGTITFTSALLPLIRKTKGSFYIIFLILYHYIIVFYTYLLNFHNSRI